MDKSDLVKFRSECIAAHNFYRSLHGTTPLVWSARLADGAQKWAEQLASADSLTYSHERGLGENIACLWGSEVTGNKVTQIWYEESQNYDYSLPRVTPNTRPFCQVVWEGTRELGAGKASTKNGKQVVVARYNPPATRKQVEKNVKSPKLDKIDGSTALATKESLGLRKFQEECLFAHNEFRVLHGAPPLHWSPSLAWAAQQWAEQLVQIGELKHNNDEMVGENLAGMVGDDLTGKECTDMWYEEVNDFDFENPGYSEETSNFSQVVWIGSELFGVGRASLGNTCIVVAFYEPPGNIEGLFGANVRLQGTRVKTYRLNKEMKTFIPPSPDLEWFRIECLVAHNYFRARHGAPPLVIGQTLNEEAQYWAERLLVTGATEDLQESRIGINVAIIHGHHVSGLKITELWYDEGTGYNFDSPGFSLSTRSFTQLIWLTSRKLGVGKATNNSGQCVVVARYEPVGNIDGLFVSNVRQRGHERNGREPMLFESDLKYRIKVEGRRSFRMSWEIEGTQTLQAVDKAREKNRLVWIESPVLPRKQMRESCDLEVDKSDEDKESGVEEGEEFEQEEPNFLVVQHTAAEAAGIGGKDLERAIVYSEPSHTYSYPDVRRSLSLDSEGTEPEPEEGRVLSRVAYFEHFDKIEKENKFDRPKRTSIELKTQLQHEQLEDTEAKTHKISEHEETVCQLEYDDVFPKHDENDERDDDFASEEEVEEDDDDVMSLETVSEAEEDLLAELDEFEMDHHIKSYCYEENYVREEDEVREKTIDEGEGEDITENELKGKDNEGICTDPDHFVASTVDRDESVREQMRCLDNVFEFVPLTVEKQRKDLNPDDVNFDETEEEKELFKYETKPIQEERPSGQLYIEKIDSQNREQLELNFGELFSKLDKPKEKPPPTLPKPKRRPKEDLSTETKTKITQTLESKQTLETIHQVESEPAPVATQKEETVQNLKVVTEEKPTETEFKEQDGDRDNGLAPDEDEFESFEVLEIDRERKMNNIFKRLNRRIQLLPTSETQPTREFDRNIDLSENTEEQELFRVYEAPASYKIGDKDPVQEDTIYADVKKRNVESEISFEEMFKRLERGEESPTKEPILKDREEPTEDLAVLESEIVEEEHSQEEKKKAVRFDKTVVVQEHETVHKELIELKEEGTASDENQYCEGESAQDVQDHCDEYEEVEEAETDDLKQITQESFVYLSHEVQESSEIVADTDDQEEEQAESFEEEDELQTSVSPIKKEESPVHFSEELSEYNNAYGTCNIDTVEPADSVADVYEDYETIPVKYISEASCSQPIHVAADVDNKPLESGVQEKSVRTSMCESFEEVLPEASASSIIEPSTCYVAAELSLHETEVEPVREEVEVDELLADEEPESTNKIAVYGIPEITESTVCITTETTFHHRTEIVQKCAPSIEVEKPFETQNSVEEEASYKEILTNGHCTSVQISHDNAKELLLKDEGLSEGEIPESYQAEKIIKEAVDEKKEEVVEQLEEPEPVVEVVEETVEKKEEVVVQLEEPEPVVEDVEETEGEREEEVEQLEEPEPVVEDVEETEKEREEEVEQLEEPEPVVEVVEETVEKKEEVVVQLEEPEPVVEDVEETVEEREEEEIEELEEPEPVVEDVETEEEREEEVEQLEEPEPFVEDVEDTVEEREEDVQLEEPERVMEDVEETVEVKEKEEKVEEIVEELENAEPETQVAEVDGIQESGEVERLQSTIVDDRFEYISEEELEETEELYERMRESFEEQDNEEEPIDEENVHIQQTAASIIHIGSQEDVNLEDFGQEPSEDEITYDSEVITEVEKEITSVLVVKESFSSTVYEDEVTHENISIEKAETESPVEETQPEALLQFVEQTEEDVPEDYNYNTDEPDLFHEDGEKFESDEVFVTDEHLQSTSITPDIEECEDLESSVEIIENKVELIQFTEEAVEHKVDEASEDDMRDEDVVGDRELLEQSSPTPDVEEEEDDLNSSDEFVEENVELIQFTEQVGEDKVIDEDFKEVVESSSESPDAVEENQSVTESRVELIQFTEQVDENKVDLVCEDEPIEQNEVHKDNAEITDDKEELIQFAEQTENQPELRLEEKYIEDEELVISERPIACSTPIFPDEKGEQMEESTSFEDSTEAGFGEKYEDMENIIGNDPSLDLSKPISLEESSGISNDEYFFQVEAEEAASKAMAEEFDDSGKLETEPEHSEELQDEKEQGSKAATTIVSTTVYEEHLTETEQTKREFIDLTPLETYEITDEGTSGEDLLSPPPIITATEFVADEEEEGSEEEYIPNFEHPRTYMVESKEVVMDPNTIESNVDKVNGDDNAQLEETKNEEKEPTPVPESETIASETSAVVKTEPEKIETETISVTLSHRTEVMGKQDSDVDDLEEKEIEERIQRKQQVMEKSLLQDEIEIREDIPEKVSTNGSMSEEKRTEVYFTSISVVKVQIENDGERIFWEEEATNKMREDELKLEEKEPTRDEMKVMKEDEALTDSAFRAERHDERQKTEDMPDEPNRGREGDEVAQVPIIPLSSSSVVAHEPSKTDTQTDKEVDYEEEVEVSKVEVSSFTEEEVPKSQLAVLSDVDFNEEIEVERVHDTEEKLEEILETDGKVDEEVAEEDVYEEEVEIQRVEHQEEGFEDENRNEEVFEEEVMIERIEEDREEEQESFPDLQPFPVYEEELDVAAEEISEDQPDDDEEDILHAEPLQEDAGEDNEEELPEEHLDAEEQDMVHAEPEQVDAGENNEVEPREEEEQAWEEYEDMDEQEQAIPQEIQGIADQGDMHLYDNNNNESLPRYYVDFSPGGSFERDSTTSDDGECPEVYRQGEPLEEDMEEFILVKYEDQSSSSGEDISDHREMYVIHEEDSEDRSEEKKEIKEESGEKTVSYDQGFVNPALEDIREEEEEDKEKQRSPNEEMDIEEKLQLEEYERLESFVILEEKLSQVESDESAEDLTSGADEKRASSEETLNDEDESSETRTSSTLKDDITSKDESGDEATSPDSHEPSELDSTLTKEVEEETIDLEDGGVLSKRTVREETYTVEEDDGDDDDNDDKDKTLTRKKVSKRVITTTTTSATHVTRIESEDHPSPAGSDNESEPRAEGEGTTSTIIVEQQPSKDMSEDIKSDKDTEERPEVDNTTSLETEEETIDLDDGGVMRKFVTREETYFVEEDKGDNNDDQLTTKTVTKKVVTTTTTSTSRVTQLEPSTSFSDDENANKVIESSSEETHTTRIKSRQPDESLASTKRQHSLENSENASAACGDPSRKRRGCIKRIDSHESEGHSSEVGSTTDSTGDSISISSEDHLSDEDFSGLDEFQIDCIRQHNIYRHQHRACRLVWSEDLAKAAATWADQLAATNTFEHSPQKESGENLACASGYDLRGDKVAEMWYDEIKDYNFEIPAFNAKCGHFTQMIWRHTKEFGVAKSIAADGTQYVVARYNPPGNVLGEFKDSIRRARGRKSIVRKRRRSSSRRQASHSSDVCDVLQREKFKNECVVSHNYYRSLHGAPPLQWSTMLANEAQTFAEKLTKSGSFMHSGNKEFGESLAFSFGLDLSGRDAVDTWYDEIVDYDYEYPGFTSHTANFTQVIWAGTKEFGMGKAIGEDGSCVVVGRYHPPGNIVGEFQENVKQKRTGYY